METLKNVVVILSFLSMTVTVIAWVRRVGKRAVSFCEGLDAGVREMNAKADVIINTHADFTKVLSRFIERGVTR